MKFSQVGYEEKIRIKTDFIAILFRQEKKKNIVILRLLKTTQGREQRTKDIHRETRIFIERQGYS